MEQERFRELLTTVVNFNWEMKPPSPERAEYERGLRQLQALQRAATNDEEKTRLRAMLKAGPPTSVRAEYGEHKKRLRDFRLSLRRDFPEWHFHDYSVSAEGGDSIKLMGQFVAWEKWFQDDLRRIWELASQKESDKATTRLLYVKMKASRWLKKVEEQHPRLNGWQQDKRAWELMVQTLRWLEGRLGSLKVCGNPKCSSRSKYFFKVYNNDRYCSRTCTSKAKASREAKRDAESQKPTKVYKLSKEHRRNMSIAAEKRWASRKRRSVEGTRTEQLNPRSGR